MAQSQQRKPHLLTVAVISAAALLSVLSTAPARAQDARGAPPPGNPDDQPNHKNKNDKGWKHGDRKNNRDGAPGGMPGKQKQFGGMQKPDGRPGGQPGGQKPGGMQKPNGMPTPRHKPVTTYGPATRESTTHGPAAAGPATHAPTQFQKPKWAPAKPEAQPSVSNPQRAPGWNAPKGMPHGGPANRVETPYPEQRRIKRVDRPKSDFHNMDQMRSRRVERKEDGGKRLIIQEPDKRTIVRQGNRLVIQKDEAQELRRFAPNARVTRNPAGITSTVVSRPNGVRIITETDRNGQIVRRYRRDGRGRDTIIIDNRRRGISGRDVAIGVGIGVVGAAILSSMVDVPPPRVSVPRHKYIVDYDDASEDDVYEALVAPPVDPLDRYYTLDQVRATHYLRERMRRVDLDDINFSTGSWDIDPGQYRKLERMARAMRRIIRRNPDEVFLIEGYTDAIGSDVDNLALSDRRAVSVSSILIEEFDVPFENLTTQGYGEQYLKINTQGPERINRRVAVRRITPLLAHAYDGPPRDGGGYDRDDDGPSGPPPRDYRDDRYDDGPPPPRDDY